MYNPKGQLLDADVKCGSLVGFKAYIVQNPLHDSLKNRSVLLKRL